MNNKTILHLGSGKCSELEGYLASDAKKIILVEANALIVAGLQKKIGDSNRVEILNYAVSDKANGKLNEFNLINASSLHKPTGLLDLFPGLQTVRTIEVQVKNLIELVMELQLNDNENNLLVVDLPGEEFNALKNLQEDNLLYLFSQIQLHCGVLSLYHDAKSASEILEYLSSFGYDILHQENSIDPERPCWTLQVNTLALENKGLKEQLSDILIDQKKLIDQHDFLSNELEKIKEEEVMLQKELVEARQTASLSIKLQALKDADLRDLQKKYGEALIIQDNQHQLLAKLSERLSLAANYFHQISENQPFAKEEGKISDQEKSQNTVSDKKNST